METQRDKELTIVLPIYNGASFIQKNVETLLNFLQESSMASSILLVDDGSTDATGSVVNALHKNHPQVRSLSYRKNRGKGYAVKKAVEQLKTPYCLVMDSDLPSTIDLRIILDLLKLIENCEIGIASRFHPKAKTLRESHRAFIGQCHRFLVRRVFNGLPTTDPDVGLKIFRSETLKKMIPYTDRNRWSWDLQALVVAQKWGYRIHEIPFDWTEDSSLSSVRIVRDSLEELHGIFHIKIQELFFLPHA